MAAVAAAGSLSGALALACPMLGAFASLFNTIGIALDGDNLGVVEQTIDKGDNAGSVGEDFTPLAESAIRCHQCTGLLVAARDQLEHQIGVAVRVGQIARFHQLLAVADWRSGV